MSNIEDLKQAASGRWPEILSVVAGIPLDVLDSRNHPCPRCGGSDRFRLVDAEAGAVLCNQCFSKRNGDGFAAIQWMLGCDFPAAIAHVANHLGIALPDPPRRGRPAHKPDDQLEFLPWSWTARYWCENVKLGVTEEALLAAGARMAYYSFSSRDYHESHIVIALPSYTPPYTPTSEPCGWVVWHSLGYDLPKSGPNGTIERCKMKSTLGSHSGLMLVHGLERLASGDDIDVIWKTGGPTDGLALFSIIPPELRDSHIIITNSGGENENPKSAWIEALRGKKVYVIHDADNPGESGAAKWLEALAPAASEVRQIKLPYEVTPDHGKDLRDWICS